MDFFGIGLLELVVILVIALLVLGPKQLPQMAYRLGAILNQARNSIAEAREGMLMDLDAERPPQGPDASPDDDEPRPVKDRPIP